MNSRAAGLKGSRALREGTTAGTPRAPGLEE